MGVSLYEIDAQIAALVDGETGEILDIDAFESLAMEREQKLENMALWYKNLTAEAAMISVEEKKLAERRKDIEKQAERLETHLFNILGGQKFSTARVACTFRSSQAVEIKDEAKFISTMAQTQRFEFLTYKEPSVNKTAVKNALKAGETVEGAEIITRNNLTIK